MLQEALDKLFVLEKQTRNVRDLPRSKIYILLSQMQAADVASTTRLAKAIGQHAYDARDYTRLNSNIHLLSKKHGQLKSCDPGNC